jgi:predicted Zn-dependent protease
MESAGIRTAVLTSPGHIFMAFDTGEPAENAASIADATHEVLTRNGDAWIPVETTILSQGFMAVWSSATTLVRSARATGNLEFIPIADMRDTYPALPLPPSVIAVTEPPAAGVDKAYASAISAFTTAMYVDRVAALRARRAALAGRQAAILQVQEGVIHALFGKRQEAERSFRAAMTAEPSLVAPYVNLANLRLLASDDKGALSLLGQGLARNKDSALLNLVAARIYSARGDTVNTALYMAAVQRSAPELAARYADLTGQAAVAASTNGSGGAQRASSAEESPAMIWSTDQ